MEKTLEFETKDSLEEEEVDWFVKFDLILCGAVRIKELGWCTLGM